MHLEKLTLSAFKNHTSLEVRFSSKFNFIVGENGVGKTNILDAIYFLCVCKSNFQHSDKLVIQHDSDYFRITGDFIKLSKREQIVCKYRLGKKKIIEYNHVAYGRYSDHIGLYPVVFIVPDDSMLINSGSEWRRKFLDVLLVQFDKAYLNCLINYNKILDQRNNYLKQCETDKIDYNLLQIYDQQMTMPAEYIHAKRSEIIDKLLPYFLNYYHKISGGRESVSLAYKSALTEQKFDQILKENYQKDVILKRTTQGIHKDNIELVINEYPLKKFASQGQLKSFLLALKLSQYHVLKDHGQYEPILLLDDIFDKLDLNRTHQLLKLLSADDFGQVFVTDTDIARMGAVIQEEKLEAFLFELDKEGNLKLRD